MRSVVITGWGFDTAFGHQNEEVFSSWYKCKQNFVKDTSVFDSKRFFLSSKIGGMNPNLLFDRKIQKATTRKDWSSLLSIARLAEHAGIKKGLIEPTRFGIFVGAPSTQVSDLYPYLPLVRECINQDGSFDYDQFGARLIGSVNPMVMMQNLMNNVLCYASIYFDAQGVNACFLDHHCAGANAMMAAFQQIAWGYCDLAVAGGSSGTPEVIHMEEGFRNGFLKSYKEEDLIHLNHPEFAQQVLPFYENSKGTLLGEASAYLCFEEEDHAVRRGAKIYGKILAAEAACVEPYFSELEDNESTFRSQNTLLNRVLNQSKITFANLGQYLSPACGSKYFDSSDRELISSQLQDIPVNAFKSTFAECLESSTPLAVILSLESYRRRRIPRSFSETNQKVTMKDLLPMYQEREVNHPYALISSKNYAGNINMFIVEGC